MPWQFYVIFIACVYGAMLASRGMAARYVMNNALGRDVGIKHMYKGNSFGRYFDKLSM